VAPYGVAAGAEPSLAHALAKQQALPAPPPPPMMAPATNSIETLFLRPPPPLSMQMHTFRVDDNKVLLPDKPVYTDEYVMALHAAASKARHSYEGLPHLRSMAVGGDFA
jgi:hypothetical protein